MSDWSLGHLADPNRNQQPIDVRGQDTDALIEQLRMMLLIRLAERCLADGRRERLIGGPVHLGVGQEAVAVGVAAELRKTDRVFGAHRSHSHVLSMGSSLRRLFAEVLGKDTGLSRGMGGSMHLWDQPNGFYGSVPIVSGTVPLAVGAALAAKMQGGGDIGVAYLGDGAVEEGVVHESLNLARMLNAPALFVVENNLFASHMHISLRQPREATARFAAANDIPYEIVDGNDVVQVRAAAARFIDRARAGGGPGFLEAVTYRWYGHVDWREDIDVGVNRSAEYVDAWRKRDPVARLMAGLQSAGLMDNASLKEMEAVLAAEVATAWQLAQNDPYPPLSATASRVFADAGSST
ncbi:thiamine pyrophosphate-dependent dehydrogenase E1 component subunit alpha [Polaromonas sp. YR568]|uniref:thiamine pyrophosphate-dependent dehydrogenase E1 component subunit alpha n=1 Tax=Polaromonas sp. YR568 TaxID=1855301 RepID=UPI0031383390